jgi:hypothetical protein
MRSFVWRFAAVLLAVICRSAIVPPATGDMCFADDVRCELLTILTVWKIANVC